MTQGIFTTAFSTYSLILPHECLLKRPTLLPEGFFFGFFFGPPVNWHPWLSLERADTMHYGAKTVKKPTRASERMHGFLKPPPSVGSLWPQSATKKR